MLIDRLVVGQDYRPTELGSGQYYWRVAPSQYETGQFFPASTFRIGPNTSVSSTPTVSSGWTVAIGSVTQAFRGNTASGDILAVNAKGSLYALDAERGVAKWVERPTATVSTQSTITPVSIRDGSKELVAMALGSEIFAVAAHTGQRAWSLLLAAGATTTSLVSDESSLLYAISSSRELLILDPLKGTIRKRTKLERPPIFKPLVIPGKGLLLPLAWRTIEVRNLEGDFVRSIEVEFEITTSPILLNSSRGTLIVVGTRSGLSTLDSNTTTPLGRVALANGDSVIGSLLAADVAGDVAYEVLVLTKDRRLAVIDLSEGKVLWSKDNPAANAPVLYDVDDNGKLDLLTTDLSGSIVGLSGADGSTLWQSEEAATSKAATPLLAFRNRDGHLLLVSRDHSGMGLRAVKIRPNSTRQVSR